MKGSELVISLSQRSPFLFRQFIAFSVQGYIPPIHKHWLFRYVASQVFEEEGLPIWHSRYRLHIPRELMDIYLNYSNYLGYEPLTSKVFLRSLRSGSVVIDVGANVGYYTLLASGAVGTSGRVHAVECAPSNLRLLEQNVKANKLSNVQIHPYAAGSARGSQNLNVSYVGLTGFNPRSRWPIVAGTCTNMDVPAFPLDEVVQSPVDLVKIDVDGFDLDVLKGMKRILSENQHLSVIVEWAPPMLSEDRRDPLELPNWLEAEGLKQIMVLDEYYGKRRSLDETKQLVRERRLPSGWACNLVAQSAHSRNEKGVRDRLMKLERAKVA